MKWVKKVACLLSFIFILAPASLSTNAASVTNQIQPTMSYYAKAKTTSSVKLVSLTSPVRHGGTASIEIEGKPNTNYSITVYYSSGASTAKGLYTKKSSSSGYVSWSWMVGTRTYSGKHLISISGGGQTFNTYFTTT